jgi:hypothetical protein
LTINNLKPNIGNEAHIVLMQSASISRRRGLVSILFGISLTVLPVNSALSLDYTIKEVIEVGEADFVPFLQPIIWSPDGSKLAFTKSGIVQISDTLGKVEEVIKLDMPIHRWDWVSDSEIAVFMRVFTGEAANTENRLSKINVNLKKEIHLHSYMTFYGYRQVEGYTICHGPFKSIEGNRYYFETIYTSNKSQKASNYKSFVSLESSRLKSDHFLRWGENGLYMVNLDESDSTWLVSKPRQQMSPKPVISFNLEFALDDNLLFRLKDSTIISLDTVFAPYPPNTIGCGAVWSSFNPVAPEVLMTISCDDGESYLIHSIATLDCNTLELTVIDLLIGKTDCAGAVFSPDGRKIGFMSDNKAYILTRELR